MTPQPRERGWQDLDNDLAEEFGLVDACRREAEANGYRIVGTSSRLALELSVGGAALPDDATVEQIAVAGEIEAYRRRLRAVVEELAGARRRPGASGPSRGPRKGDRELAATAAAMLARIDSGKPVRRVDLVRIAGSDSRFARLAIEKVRAARPGSLVDGRQRAHRPPSGAPPKPSPNRRADAETERRSRLVALLEGDRTITRRRAWMILGGHWYGFVRLWESLERERPDLFPAPSPAVPPQPTSARATMSKKTPPLVAVQSTTVPALPPETMPPPAATLAQLGALWDVADQGKVWLGFRRAEVMAKPADRARLKGQRVGAQHALRGCCGALRALPGPLAGEAVDPDRLPTTDPFRASREELMQLWGIARTTEMLLDKIDEYDSKGTGKADLDLRLMELGKQHDVLTFLKPTRKRTG